MSQDNNIIKLKDIQNLFNKVFKAGYENTIDLKINGEYYQIIKE